MVLTPQNVEFHATFLKSDVVIKERVIIFGPGVGVEKLIEVPIGEVDPHATIVITVGQNKTHPNTPGVDSDPIVGISDGIRENLFVLRDVANYNQLSSCHPLYGSHDDIRVSPDNEAPPIFKLTFTPFNKFGFCETAQEGGYINTATFNSQIDVTKPLFLSVRRADAYEMYYFHYFKVEIYEGLQTC